MKYLPSALTLVLIASPALAHPGPHMHPHSIQSWIVGITAFLVALVVSHFLKVGK